MHKTILVISLFLLFNSCKKNSVPDEPIQSDPPAAIKQIIADSEMNNPDCECHPLINQYLWEGKNVYVTSADDAANFAENRVCDWIPGYYNSKGEMFTVGAVGAESYKRFLDQAKFIKIVWACR